MPVLDYVHNKCLTLQSYTLSIGHCNALGKAFEHFKDFINRAIFDNCGIDDKEFASILRGIQKLRDFKKIIYRYNVFSEESLIEFRNLLKRKIPNHLEEMRLENCKIEPATTTRLLEAMLDKCFLKKVALVNCNLTAESLDLLRELLQKSSYIEEIDITWNYLKPINYASFIDELA